MKIIKLVSDEVIENTDKNWTDKILERIFSKSFENKLIEQVEYWYLEIDEEKKNAHREIGFNQSHKPIIYFPNQKNRYGYWSDSQVLFIIEEYEEIESNQFEKIWAEIKNKYVA